MPSLPPKIKILLMLAKNSWKIEIKTSPISLFHMKTRVCLKYFVNDCKLDSGSYMVFINKSASQKIGALICSMKFLSSEVAPYLYKSTI